MFKTVLVSFINPEHELCLLANKINWDELEKDFAPLYGTVGRPSIPIRTIVGLLLLKQMYNMGGQNGLSDHLPPILVDHHGLLTINKLSWSGFSGEGWSK